MGQQQVPISNVIGRIRFIPGPRSTKSILVLSPPEFLPKIRELIAELDKPGKQVMIKAIIVEVEQSNMTSLGIELSSDSSKWDTLSNENAITALTNLAYGDVFGSFTLDVASDITGLLEFLVKEVDAKILNQQTLWTKDNEEAVFFKGKEVAFQTNVSITSTGLVQTDFEYENVGMTLQARPSITPEKDVDMIIKVNLSQLTSDEINNQPVRTEMDTRTNMIVRDGQTIMLGGILFQKDSLIKRKVPLLGDVPIVGGLFRHEEVIQSNTELLIFITPYVVDVNSAPETIRQIEEPKKKLDEIARRMDELFGTNIGNTGQIEQTQVPQARGQEEQKAKTEDR